MGKVGTHHTLPPKPISRRLDLGRLALNTRRLFVTRHHHADGLTGDGIPSGAIHLRQLRRLATGLGVLWVSSALKNHHADADEAVAEEDGDEENDEDQQDGELAGVDVFGDGEGEICLVRVNTYSLTNLQI